jgi:hypothetical protein
MHVEISVGNRKSLQAFQGIDRPFKELAREIFSRKEKKRIKRKGGIHTCILACPDVCGESLDLRHRQIPLPHQQILTG